MNDFLNMGGYALYVWASFGLSLVGLGVIYYSARQYFKKQKLQIEAWVRRNQSK